MASYQYIKNHYYINDRQKVEINEQNNRVESDFEWILQCQEKEFDIERDRNLKKGHTYLGFIHELTHYYQDLSLASCIGEHLYKNRILRHFIDTNSTGTNSPTIIYKGEEEIYHEIYETPCSISKQSILSFCKGNGELEFSKERAPFFPCITYKDLIEGYAEMKAWQSIICETSDSTENHIYIHELLKSRNGSLYDDKAGNASVDFSYDNELDRYTLVRSLFLSFFHHCIPNNYHIYNNVTLTSDVRNIDYLLTMGAHHIIKFNKDAFEPVTSSDYLVTFELQLLTHLLFALDIALTIPPTHVILRRIREKQNRIEDFHPCCRFFKILSFIYRYPEYITDLNPENNWMTVFNDVSNVFGWPDYEETISDLLVYNTCFHQGLITVVQNSFLEYRKYTTMENNNGAIFRFFRDKQIPIIIKYLDFLLFNYYTEDKQLLQVCLPQDYLFENLMDSKYTSKNNRILMWLYNLYKNDFDMKLYNYVSSNQFKCIFSSYCKNKAGCSIESFLSIFKIKEMNCLLQRYFAQVNNF